MTSASSQKRLALIAAIFLAAGFLLRANSISSAIIISIPGLLLAADFIYRRRRINDQAQNTQDIVDTPNQLDFAEDLDVLQESIPQAEVPGLHREGRAGQEPQDDRRAGQDLVSEQEDKVEVGEGSTGPFTLFDIRG